MTFLSVVFALLAVSPFARAEFVSFRNAHPIAWMHHPPVGEMPGWANPLSIDLEFAQSNVWNKQAEFTNLATGRQTSFTADFEQSAIILDLGVGLSKRWAFGVEVPFANRNGGVMDDAIDQFHVLIHSDRFLRNRYGEFGDTFSMEDENVEQLSTRNAAGVGSVKFKLKYWFAQWRGGRPGACECGIAVSTQVKAPMNGARDGLSSGSVDGSVLAHVGVPIGADSGVWLTAAYSKWGKNPLTAPYPVRSDQRMYEISADLGLYKTFGVIAQVRTESPVMNVGSMRFDALSTDPQAIKYERLSTAWNAMNFWRGSEAFGIRWRWGSGHQVNVLATEDFGTGSRDELGTAFYSNNAPDFALVTQFHATF